MSSLHRPIEQTKIAASAAYDEFKIFFGCPVFFIILGCSFLLIAYKLMDETHPSFVFLLAILGISIVLYGTGTQGVGSADFKNVPIRVVVAGGAGILAAVFGFGIVWQGEKIPEVFKTQRKYGLIRLINGDTTNYDFSSIHFSAKTFDGMPLHLLTRSNLVQIIMPLSEFTPTLDVCVSAVDPSRVPLTPPDYCIKVAEKTIDEMANKDEKKDTDARIKKGNGAHKNTTSKTAMRSERRDFERIYEASLLLNPGAIPKGDTPAFTAQ